MPEPLIPPKAEHFARIVGYLPGCYPDRDTYRKALMIVAASGIRAIEIGIPGAIGTLEGGVIAEALQTVEKRCASPTEVVVNASIDVLEAGLIPIVMAFRETVFERVGLEPFLESVEAGGAAVVLVPDASVDEFETLCSSGASRNIRFVPFASATDTGRKHPTRDIRCPDAPFVYLQTADMATGGDFTATADLRRRINTLRDTVNTVPIGLGFGIRTRQDVERVLDLGADFAIIGTPMVESLNRGLHHLKEYLATLTQPGLSGQPGQPGGAEPPGEPPGEPAL